MKIDLSISIQRELFNDLLEKSFKTKRDIIGHIGTHFDVMNKEFSLENTTRNGRLFDVRNIRAREINITDIDLNKIKENDFVIFYTGYLGEEPYGTEKYFTDYPVLSKDLIDNLISKKVNLIGIDTASIVKPDIHIETDQYCADNGIFIIENLNNLELLFNKVKDKSFKVYTFPINIKNISGLPCRVIAEI
ncbi:cyclase family protein [Anaerophilus nitritogenes]|uniref:cyclase family protein n=1 Tax=Anaerophilus nitritogenes TaxID=2498136 RepID=UPI00101B9546|nr:cyclase family protein [Anaerophilus nitritogenes]